MFKLTAISGLLIATAIFATIPVSPQVTPQGLQLSVDQAQAVIYGRAVGLPAGSSGVTIATPGEPSAGARSLRRSVSAVPVLMKKAAGGVAVGASSRGIVPP